VPSLDVLLSIHSFSIQAHTHPHFEHGPLSCNTSLDYARRATCTADCTPNLELTRRRAYVTFASRRTSSSPRQSILLTTHSHCASLTPALSGHPHFLSDFKAGGSLSCITFPSLDTRTLSRQLDRNGLIATPRSGSNRSTTPGHPSICSSSLILLYSRRTTMATMTRLARAKAVSGCVQHNSRQGCQRQRALQGPKQGTQTFARRLQGYPRAISPFYSTSTDTTRDSQGIPDTILPPPDH
jgi:hypothetical protein